MLIPSNGLIRSTFCGIDTVACITGHRVERLYDLVEMGHYLWVWNISCGIGAKRELRFWSREINDPSSTVNLTLDTVIDAILPNRMHMSGQFDGLRRWEFHRLLRISKASLGAMRKELGVCGTTRQLFIPRANLERFFRNRWLGMPDKEENASSKATN